MKSTPIIEIPVDLGKRSYCVAVGRGILSSIGGLLPPTFRGKIGAIITDSNVGPLYAERTSCALQGAGCEVSTITFPAGEPSKNLSNVSNLCEEMIRRGLDRSAFVVALGGGVVGDLAGFVSAIHCRGIPYIQVATSVVAQVDSSVGGKTGVNASSGKNMIGVFHQPSLVVADTDLLATLPEREFNEGFAEAIKHGIIRDPAILDRLVPHNPEHLPNIIADSVRIKAAIVSADEEERTGLRALLNFGHTIGHAIENAAGYGVYLHGEAIALGIIAACRLSEKKAGLSAAATQRITDLIQQFKLPTHLPHTVSDDQLMSALSLDKKFVGGRIRFVLARSLGDAFVAHDVKREEILSEITALRK